MAGRHRKTTRHRGRHRKPPSPARIALPVGTAAAVVVASIVVFNHADANGQPSPVTPAVPVAASDPPPSVLAFHTTRPVVRHVARRAGSPSTEPPPQSTPTAPLTGCVPDPRDSDCYLQVTNHGGKLLVRRILHRGDHAGVPSSRLARGARQRGWGADLDRRSPAPCRRRGWAGQTLPGRLIRVRVTWRYPNARVSYDGWTRPASYGRH